ncbi:MAG TPA: nucleoside hydrolase [Clostridiales bacterium]|nr:nucleoside hydrolase [Clostridiales bacterium]
MDFPKIPADLMMKLLEPPVGRVRMVLDTDTYNEVDDQFALAYAIKSGEKISLEAIYAAPFYNDRSTGPAEGMELSFQEINKILSIMNCSSQFPVFRGSTDYLKNRSRPEESDAVKDLIKRAMESDEKDPLYVVAIGAVTNVASAIMLEPDIIKKIVVVWLGGNALHWHDTKEFNLMQDIAASRVILDSGVPLIRIPVMGVTTHLHTTIPELESCLSGKSPIGTYLTDIVKNYTKNPYAWSKVIWDVAAIAWIVNPDWVPTHIEHSPVLTDQLTWSFDRSRHLIRSAYFVHRDPVFGDLFKKLTE